jgi:hypothetical protein
MLQASYHIFIHRAFLEGDADVGTGGIAKRLGVDVETAAGDDFAVYQMLYTLVNGGTGDVALCSYVFEWYTGIL